MAQPPYETTLRQLYAARLTNDATPCLAFFADDASFRLAGSQEHSAFAMAVHGKAALQSLVLALSRTWHWDSQEIQAILVDGQQAAVRYRLTTTHVPSGRRVTTEIMDHIVFDASGRIREMVEFVDTAMVAGLSASHAK